MLKRLDNQIRQVILEMNLNEGYLYAEDILEDAFDNIGFNEFSELLENNDFINKLENTKVEVLEEAKDSLWNENIEKYDDDNERSKSEAVKFYNYLKELILKKAS